MLIKSHEDARMLKILSHLSHNVLDRFEWGILLRLVDMTVLMLIIFYPFNTQGREFYLGNYVRNSSMLACIQASTDRLFQTRNRTAIALYQFKLPWLLFKVAVVWEWKKKFCAYVLVSFSVESEGI